VKCSIIDCIRDVKAKGLCNSHYNVAKGYYRGEKGRERYKLLTSKYARTSKSKFTRLIFQAKNSGRIVGINFEQFCELVSSPCHYCGNVLPETGYGLDRKDNDLGYIIGNIVPCCKDCNKMKGEFITYDEMLALFSFRNESIIASRMVGGC
jgi:hypothetical protein